VFEVEAPNLVPLAPHGLGEFVPAMALIYISYVGFELITVASEEIVDPGRTIPRAIMITLGVATAIYVFVVGVMMGTVHHTELATSEVPFILVSERLLGGWGRWAAILATVMASLSAFSVTLGASARVLYALGRDGHFPYGLAALHRKFRTPHRALAICAIAVVVFGSSGLVEFVASVSDFGYLMGLGIVNLAVVSLQSRMPNLRRPYRARWYPWIPVLGAISCWVFVPALEISAFVLGGGLTVVGATIYLYKPAHRAEIARIRGVADQVKTYLKLRKRKKMRVLIVGGGNKGQSVASRLMARDEHRMVFRSAEHQVTFMEKSEALCADLERRFGVPVYHGDGTKRELLEQVGLDNMEVTVAATDDDGTNVIVAMQARRLGVNQVIALVTDPDYVPLLEENGVVAISAPWATAAQVEDYLDRPGVADLFEIGTGAASLVGGFVPEGAEVAGKAIREIEIPRECTVAAVLRGDDYVVPRGDTIIEEGDHVIFVGVTTAVRNALDRFVYKRAG
jgi:Trk K+ transport system NAD-binding subunit